MVAVAMIFGKSVKNIAGGMLVAGALAASMALGIRPASALDVVIDDDFIVDDVLVSNPETPMADPEFDPVAGFVAWQLGPNTRISSGRLLVARVNPINGEFLELFTDTPMHLGGRGTEIDRDLVPRENTTNGPEFAYARDGSRLLYTKFVGDGQTHIGQAVFDGVTWIPELLPLGQNRTTPEGSQQLDDERPKMAYYGFVLNESGALERILGLRLIDFPGSERFAPRTLQAVSFLPKTSAVLGTDLEKGLRQIFYYDFSAGTLKQITDEPTQTIRSPEPWVAPDYADATLVAVNVFGSGSSSIRVHEMSEPEQFDLVLEFGSPDPAKPSIQDPIPFVFAGRSYLAFRTQVDDQVRFQSDIWVVDLALDGSGTLVFRRINESGPVVRSDVEIYLAEEGPMAYYTESLEGGFQRVRRARTGL